MKAVGIDLGTTNSVIAVLEGGEPSVITNSEGRRTTPSVVAFRDDDVLVGEVAKRQAVTNPDRTVSSVKREMGTDMTFTANGKTFTPQEVSAQILAKLKRDAEAFLGEKVTDAVITVPAYFNDAQRQATKEAGQIAGLTVRRIVNEPTAAALAYGLDKEGERTVLVFDLGGGTFDVSVLDLGGGVFEVRSTAGDTHLGGDDWDQRIVDWLVSKFKAEHGVDLATDRMATQRLREAAEKAKTELSSVPETEINLPFITATTAGPLHMQYRLSRSEFEVLTEDLLERCKAPFAQALKDAGVSTAELDDVILVGGSTRMPAVVQLVEALSHKTPHKGVNPDEVVAAGAALQAGVLTGDKKDILLLDVTPLTLSIETKGGIATAMIDRNTTIPTRRSETFTTADDNQPEVEVHVVQGERALAGDNASLGRFRLTGLPPAPAGVPQIEVTFDIDANGIVHVSAKDLGTGRSQAMTITGGSALSKKDIDRMVADAERFADEDRDRREAAEVRNRAEGMARAAKSLVTEHGDRLDPQARSQVSDAAVELQRLVDGGADASEVSAAVDRLGPLLQEAGASLYAQQGVPTDLPDDDDVVEAEVVG